MPDHSTPPTTRRDFFARTSDGLLGAALTQLLCHDDFGHSVVEHPVSVHDFHATILHLLGLHHQKLFLTRSGLEERLTGFELPRVVTEILS